MEYYPRLKPLDSRVGINMINHAVVFKKNTAQKIAVIGAGISGLAAAHHLKKLGYGDVTVFEKEGAVGGKVLSVECNLMITGWLVTVDENLNLFTCNAIYS